MKTRPGPIRDLAVPRLSEGVTRRQFIVGGLAFAALVAGCGDEANEPTGEAAETGTGADSPFPVSIEHKYGTTEITEAPERVVSVGYNDQDPLLALGVVPVAVRDFFGDQPNAVWPWARDQLGDATPEVLSSAELNFEQIAALRPDLIIGVYSGMTEEEYAKLSQIAPTVAQTDEFVDFGVPWQEQTLLTGRAVGRLEQAEKLVADLEKRFQSVRDEHPEFEGASVVAALTGEAEYYAYGPEDLRARFFTSLGFEIPDRIAELAGDEFFATISEEQFELLQADLIVWIINTEQELAALQASQIYQQLPAVKDGRDILLPTFGDTLILSGALGFNTVLSLPLAIEGLVPMIVAALDGDPTTEATPAP